MNIAILIPSLVTGGAERAAALLGDYYYDKGHNVYYFLIADGRRPFFKVKGKLVRTFVFFPYPGKGLSENVRELAITSKEFKKLKKEYSIDVAVSYMELCNFINVCSKGNEKVIISVRTYLSERREYTGILYNPKWIRAVYKRADKVVAVSNSVKDDLIGQYKIPEAKIASIPNISTRHKEDEGGGRWQYGDKSIVCVGRLVAIKQYERAIRAFSYTYQRDSDARLILVGDGEEKNYLKDVSQKAGVDKAVIFADATKNVGYYFQHAKAFVMSSRAEGFPNVMVEAMAYGVPVITTDSYGGCGEIVGKIKSSDEIQYCAYGILTPHIEGKAPKQTELVREEVLLGAAMSRILEDDELQKKYSDLSKKRSRDFSEEKIMALWNKLICN